MECLCHIHSISEHCILQLNGRDDKIVHTNSKMRPFRTRGSTDKLGLFG